MDLFAKLRELPTVSKVSNLYQQVEQSTINFVFFICPKMKAGFKLNPNASGFDAEYAPGVLSSSAFAAIDLAQRFLAEFAHLGCDFNSQAIYASADAIILPSVPTTPPTPPIHNQVAIVANDQLVLADLPNFGQLYRSKPWQKLPQRLLDHERQRLETILPSKTPRAIVSDFIDRTWAGFALDGILIQKGYFGANPVLLGVESPGVAILQSSALPREFWLPVIQLV